MDQNMAIALDNIHQKAIIEGDEQGTKAAAVIMALAALTRSLWQAPQFELMFIQAFISANVNQITWLNSVGPTLP
jgi:serine protease inhibitor